MNCAIQGCNLAREYAPDYASFLFQVMGRNLAREYAPDYGIVQVSDHTIGAGVQGPRRRRAQVPSE